MQLVWPSAVYLPGYREALERGWSSDNMRPEAAIREQLELIATDPADFLRRVVDREAKAPPIVTASGILVPRLPGYQKWMWDGEFCGSIGFRWQPGTNELPPTCLGHVGYSVVPWKRNRGYATRALALLLPEAKAQGLAYVELTTDPANVASQRVILANGGVLVEPFVTGPEHHHKAQLRFRIDLT